MGTSRVDSSSQVINLMGMLLMMYLNFVPRYIVLMHGGSCYCNSYAYLQTKCIGNG